MDFTTETFDATIAEGLTFVDFWAPWCGPCRMQAPVVEQLAEDYDGRITVGKVNVDEEAELAGRFGIMSIPTMILFKDGQPIQKLVGLHSQGQLEAIFDSALGE
ncbi:thioredoxin [Atopobacter sp. AH10]|uniref:thioredoxin n=1 Tax=Atopobacter sp. AH10 TaxID=2315861 RepID=UPI000EF2142C|nr:thioredoxin [Atopobacter sp. AH10]RLK63960.1 thioredoxin [Atopobacter sp. AH10]